MAEALPSIKKQDQNFETYSLIWLDASVNNSQENIQAQKQLRISINHLITFENEQQCLEYIQSGSKDDRIILIVSGQLGQIIVPKIIQFRQIISIYVYCMNKNVNEQWAQHFSKVRAVIVELDELIHRIQTDQHRRKHNKINESIPIYIINSNDINQEKSTNELDGQFLYSQLLIDCLVKIKSTINDKNELISLCKQQYQGNSVALSLITEFERDYSSDRSLWWYTRDSFLYKMLNKALRVQNIHLLFLFRFIIRDIEQQLEINKCSSPVCVYRAQLMSNDEVEMLKNSLGEFISINSFLSTSFDREQAQSFFTSDDKLNDLERVFLEIDADPRLDNIKPFSDISSKSSYPKEKEVLFMIGSIFRLMNIDRDQDGILILRMKLCSNNDHHLKPLFQHMQKKHTNGGRTLLTFADVLKDMGKLDDAEKYYQRLLNELPANHKHIASCYRGLGGVAYRNGDYDLSLTLHNKSLEIKMRTLEPYDVSIADSHSKIGSIYQRKKDYPRALESFNKALTIYKHAFGEDHPYIASCLNNMSIVYEKKHEYSKALELSQKALSIYEKHLPADHADLGRSHKNIGNIHADMGNFDLALSHYNLTLKIYKKSRPDQHPSITSTLIDIGLAYEDKGDFEQALSYLEKAATMYHHSLSSTHPEVIRTDKDIRRISSKLK